MPGWLRRRYGVFSPLWLQLLDGTLYRTQITMNSIDNYPLGPFQQAVLAAMPLSPQLLLADKSQAAAKPARPNVPPEFIIDFEDHRNHGIGD